MYNNVRSHLFPQYGFTLIEMLVAISIATVIGLMGFAAYNSFSSQQVLSNAASDVKNSIEHSKNNAIARVKKATNCGTNPLAEYEFILTQPNSYSINYVCTGVPGAPVYNNESFSLPTSVTFHSSSTCGSIEFLIPSNTVILHNAVGSPITTPCTIVLENSDGTLKPLTVDTGGNVQEP